MSLYNDLRALADDLERSKNALLDFQKQERALAFDQERARVKRWKEEQEQRQERLRA
jgi:hypothetical protein